MSNATKIVLPTYKNSLPHGGTELVEKFVSRMIPGGQVEWRGGIWKRAGIGVSYGYAPNAAERANAWEVARAVLALIPKRVDSSCMPMGCKSRVISRSEAEAALEAKYGLGDSSMVSRHSGAE